MARTVALSYKCEEKAKRIAESVVRPCGAVNLLLPLASCKPSSWSASNLQGPILTTLPQVRLSGFPRAGVRGDKRMGSGMAGMEHRRRLVFCLSKVFALGNFTVHPYGML